jgi:hypothetical protein
MGLEIRKNRFAKSYENSFFRIFAKELKRVFDELKLDGVLIGGGITDTDLTLAPDALLISNSAVVIIDFKKYGGKIELPAHSSKDASKYNDSWFNGLWYVNGGPKFVKGGVRNNPFTQLGAQSKKLNTIVEKNVIPFLLDTENYELKDTHTVVCFQLEIDLIGTIDPRFERTFHIADHRQIIDTIRDLIDVVPNERPDSIQGFKLTENAFNLFKKEFKADLYDPLAENQLYREKTFSDVEFPIIDNTKIEELINEEIDSLFPKLEDFISGKEKILRINSDVTSFSYEIVNGLLEKIIKYNDKDDVEDIESINDHRLIFLAPTNKNVIDVIRDGAPAGTRSLYGKLYDFENSRIELLNNSLNEREEFPLLKNKDPKGSIYVIYYAQLVYDFGTVDENSLLRFGSGSLANDVLDYINIHNSENKVILMNDPYFYGHRAETLASDSFLLLNNLSFVTVNLKSSPININQSSISNLVNNIQGRNFSHFNIRQYPNITSLNEKDFGNEFKRLVETNEINNKIILARENEEAQNTNNWIRRKKGFNENSIQQGDVLLIKNRILVPEETDPFSLPKFVQNGELVEVIEVIERKSFRSQKEYNLREIKVSKCRVKLKEFQLERVLYLSETPLDDNEKELSKHKQIRLRELVTEYMDNKNITEKDIFIDQKEYQLYLQAIEELTSSEGVFKGEHIDVDSSEKEKRINKLKSNWKINKRKENYVKNELLKDFESEYFMITQSGQFRYGWSINLHNAYGYRFSETMLPAFSKPSQNIERFHSFLYSAISVSDRIMCQSFNGINSWFGIEITTTKGEFSESSNKKDFMIQLKDEELSEEEIEFRNQLSLEQYDLRLTILGNWILKQFEPQDSVTIDKIVHNNFLEEYTFRNSEETCRIQFYYNGKWQVRYPKEIGNTSLGKLIALRLNNVSEKTRTIKEEPFLFEGQSKWNILEYSKLNEKLESNNIFITQVINKGEYFDILKFESVNESCFMEIWFNKNRFFSKATLYADHEQEIAEKIIYYINQLKND